MAASLDYWPFPWRIVSPAHDPQAFDIVAANGAAVARGYWGGRMVIEEIVRTMNAKAKVKP